MLDWWDSPDEAARLYRERQGEATTDELAEVLEVHVETCWKTSPHGAHPANAYCTGEYVDISWCPGVTLTTPKEDR